MLDKRGPKEKEKKEVKYVPDNQETFPLDINQLSPPAEPSYVCSPPISSDERRAKFQGKEVEICEDNQGRSEDKPQETERTEAHQEDPKTEEPETKAETEEPETLAKTEEPETKAEKIEEPETKAKKKKPCEKEDFSESDEDHTCFALDIFRFRQVLNLEPNGHKNCRDFQ